MKLNVIIPVYNSSQYLDILFSLLKPQLSDIDNLIFVDDGSEDDSYRILCNWCSCHQNVRVYQSSVKGASAARQEGLKHVKEGYVTFVDSDDLIAEDYFKNVKNMLYANKGFDMYVLSYTTNFSDKSLLPRINKTGQFFSGKAYAESIFDGSTIGDMALWNHIYDIEFIRAHNIEFDINAQIAEDCLFNDICILNAEKVFVSNYNGYTWICGHESLTSRCPLNMGETLRKHINYCMEIKDKYELSGEYVFRRKKWAFSYLVHNIIYSQHARDTKEELLNKALHHNLDKEVIIRGYFGLERALLNRAYNTGNVKFYYVYCRYNLKAIWGRLLIRIGILKRGITGIC